MFIHKFRYYKRLTMSASIEVDICENVDIENQNSSYHKYLDVSEKNTIKTMKFYLKNGTQQVCLLVQMDPELIASLDSKYHFVDDIKHEWNCNVCKNRLHYLRTLIDANGEPLFCNITDNNRSRLQRDINKKCRSLIDVYNSNFDFRWRFHIVYNGQIYSPTEGTEADTGIAFRHYSYKTDYVSDNISRFDRKWLPKALDKYCPLLNNLLLKVGKIDDILVSCTELKKLLLKSRYGKTQVSAINWFIDILILWNPYGGEWKKIHFAKRIEIIAKTICRSPYCEGDSESAHIGFFHTINGYILDILENGKSPESVVKMIEERNDPSVYRRKIADPSEGNIRAAEKLCENLVNTIETIEQLESHPGCVKVNKSVNSITSSSSSGTMASAFAEMRKDNMKNKFGGFADRMNIGKPSTAKTLTEIIRDIGDGIINKIEIETCGLSVMYTAHTTLDESDISVNTGHLWCYLNGNMSRFSTKEEVTHIYNFKSGRFNNIIFVLKNAKESLNRYPIKGNCIFPEFLAPKHRGCERAVEKLCRMTNIRIPDSSEISLGMGSSVGYNDNSLVVPVTLHITSGNGNHKHTAKITCI